MVLWRCEVVSKKSRANEPYSFYGLHSSKVQWCPNWCPRPVLQKKYAVSENSETAYLRGFCWSE